MSAALQSGHWFRLAALKPRLRGHARIHRHVYRGEVWYVVHDRISGEHHRFNAAAYELVRQLDGRRSMQQIWDELSAHQRDNAPTQAELLQVLGRLNAADLLVSEAAGDVTELLDRGAKRKRRKFLSRFMNPMALRFPMWDPDAFLSAATTWLRPMPTLLWLALWLAVALPALVLMPSHWPELTHNFSERLLSVDNLWVMAISFPLLKAGHELAHGFAVKRGGGEVHEMGLMLLVFYPVPYVDASAAHAFGSKWRRAWVCAAGMAIEVWLALLAFLLWLLLEPGLARSIAYNVLVLGSVTTILFNANPLLRYDGYFLLADLIEIPNLGQRSTQYWQYLSTRYIFGIHDGKPFPASRSERRWFLYYAPLAFVYRTLVVLGIAWFVAQEYFLIGSLLAAWAVTTGVLWPMLKAFRALFSDPRFVARSGRVWSTLWATAAVAASLLFALPAPYHSRLEGVLWLPEKAMLRASADGFVDRLQVQSGLVVEVGDPVLRLVDAGLTAGLQQQAGRVAEVQARLDAVWGTQPAEAGRLLEELTREQAALARLEEQAAALVTRALAPGRLVIDSAQDLPGRFLHKGDLIGHVIGPHAPVVRIVVPQSEVDLVRSQAGAVQVRLVQDLSKAIPATLSRGVPQAARELPSAALGQAGGGRQVVDPRDDRQLTAIDTLFEFEVALPQDVQVDQLGGHAYVSVEHADEPVGWRWLRAVRRALMSRFEV